MNAEPCYPARGQRWALGLEFNGAAFRGWQTQQPGVRSVQATLEAALSRVANHPVTLHAAGRTDAGVHALGQVAHVFVTSPAVAGLFQIRALNFREIGLTFLRYTVVMQAPELPQVIGIDVTENGDGSSLIDYNFDRNIDLNPGEPFTFTGSGIDNLPPFTGPDGFGETDTANVIAMASAYVTDHWEVTVTLEDWLGTLPGEAIRLQGCIIEATGGHPLRSQL